MDYPGNVSDLTQRLRDGGYLADRGLATTMLVALSLGRPVLLEGEVGVGKTEIAKVLANVFGRTLIRLQCYEGITVSQALYEWEYARQMLRIRALSAAEAAGRRRVRGVPARSAIGLPDQRPKVRVPDAADQLTRKVVVAVQRLRELDLAKPPGVAETIDWVRTLEVLGQDELSPAAAADTIGAVVKDRDDLTLVQDQLAEIVPGG
ncbi:MAG TPA: MoxR family ATPase [Trebonia sp.]|nr:MoxR family ATPase [Trebonia sp.]